VGGREADSSEADNPEGVSVYPGKSAHLLTRSRDRNWLQFLALLDVTFSAEGDTAEYVEETRKFFTEITQRDGRKDRSGALALLELEKRAKECSISKGIHTTRLDPLYVFIVLWRPEGPGELPQVVLRSIW
jgi:hypothetical protein